MARHSVRAAVAGLRLPETPVLHALPHSLASARYARMEAATVFLVPAITITALGAANGGYFPTSWNWATLAFLWICATVLVVRRDAGLARGPLILLAAWGGFTLWIWLSALWSAAPWRTLLEGQRALVYVTALALVVLLVRRRSLAAFLGGVLVAITIVSAYALGTRLFPDRIGVFDPIAGYRLSTPLGYWNAVGIFAALGSLLAIGFAARARSTRGRAAAAVALVVLVPTVYFTFSRGAFIALGAGLAAAIALDPRRLQFVGAALFATAAPAVAVLVAARSDALTHSTSQLVSAAHDGGRLALLLFVLAFVAVALTVLFSRLERREYSRRTRRGYAVFLLAVPLCILALVFMRYGGPATIAHDAYASFKGPPAPAGANLNKRLFTLRSNGRVDAWHEALDDAGGNLLAGSGAGTFEPYWYVHRPTRLELRDAHSLYLETLAEVGILGVALLGIALAIPLVAAVRARQHRFAPAAVGVYVAYLVHAAADWDWEIPAVTVTALFGAAALVVLAPGQPARTRLQLPVRAAGVSVAIAIAALSLVAYKGNNALAATQDAAEHGQYGAAARDARRAAFWAPWSPEPWRGLGEVEAGRGNLDAAGKAYARAITKDASDWRSWYGLAAVSAGPVRRHALEEARRLNPRGRELEELTGGSG